MNNPQGRAGMPFIIASSLLAQNQHLEDSLLARINLIALIFSITRAILNASGCKIALDDLELMETTTLNISALRDSYEPFMDDPEGAQASGDKRKTSEKLLDLTRYGIIFLITKYELVDSNTMKTIKGVDWE